MSSNTNRAVASLEEAISALEAERDQLDDQIKLMQDTLEKLTGAAPKKRGPGRPPGSPNRKKPGPKPGSKRKSTTTNKTAAVKRKASWTPAKRKATSERMKKYWADRRKAKK